MDSKNFILAFSLSFVILYSYQYFFDTHTQDVQSGQQIVTQLNDVKSAEPSQGKVFIEVDKTNAQKIEIRTPSMNGYFTLVGNDIEHISLVDYKQNVDSDDPVVILSSDKYKVNMGFDTAQNISVPSDSTIWKVNGNTVLTPSTPVHVLWTSPEGLVFERIFTVDSRYLITITTKIKNNTNAAVQIMPKYSITKMSNNEASGAWVLNEGAVGYLNGSLVEQTFQDMLKKQPIVQEAKEGWIGLTDNYWLVALIPTSENSTSINIGKATNTSGDSLPEVTVNDGKVQINPNAESTLSMNLFVGAKEVVLLDGYEQSLGIKHFDLAVDYGYMYFITKPMLYLLLTLNDYAQNMGIAILLITILIKLLLFPLANKSYRSMKKMKNIQPKIKQLQSMYADDKAKLSEQMFALYKKEQVNPVGSCLPMLLQIPFMFALYKVIMVTIEMRHAPFFGWIKDLSVADPTSIFNLFGLLSFDLPGFLKIGAWPIIMGITMYIQQRMTPQVTTDKSQETMMKLLPLVFTYMMSSLSVGLIIYWSFSNILQITQQYILDRIEARQDTSEAK